MRHLITLIALATALISTPVFSNTFKSPPRNLGKWHQAPDPNVGDVIKVFGGMRADIAREIEGSGYVARSSLTYACLRLGAGGDGPVIETWFTLEVQTSIPGIKIQGFTRPSSQYKLVRGHEMRGIFNGPDRVKDQVVPFRIRGWDDEPKRDGDMLYFKADISLPLLLSGNQSTVKTPEIFERIKTGEVTSVQIEIPIVTGGFDEKKSRLVFQYDTDNFPADVCDGR